MYIINPTHKPTSTMLTPQAQLSVYMNEMFMGILQSIFAIFNKPSDANDQEHARVCIRPLGCIVARNPCRCLCMDIAA